MSHIRMNIWASCILLLTLSLSFVGCKSSDSSTSTETASTEVASANALMVAAQSFIEASDGVEKAADGSAISFAAGDESATFDLQVPQAGRYKLSLEVSNATGEAASFWVEDYIDNTDGRTYNITGTMTVDEAGETTLSRDGSPLNAGLHHIRVHKSGGAASLKAITIDLIRPRTETPLALVQNMEGEEWEIVWADEFDGTGMPDTTKWMYDVGDWGWGNNELQYYTVAQSRNARLEDGNLIIEAHKNDNGHAWSSARLTTREKVSFTYGKIEFRAKVPVNKGNWAAGWTLGDAYVDEKSWPYCGEIDILESVGYEMDNASGDGKAHASVHTPAYYFKLGNQRTSTIDVKNMHEAFHTYAVVWVPGKITGYVDDKPYFEYEDDGEEGAWPFDQAQSIILNLAMGGGWGGAQGMDTTMNQQAFVLDYVRVYGKK